MKVGTTLINNKAVWISEILLETIKAQSSKEDLLTVIQQSWNHCDEEYGSKLLKSIPKIIKATTKSDKEQDKY